VSASATTAALQTTFGSSASAKSGSSNGSTTNQILHDQATSLAKELSVDEKILVQLKLFRKGTEKSLTTLNASSANIGKNTANIDKNAADTLVPLNSIATDNKLLVESYPDPGHFGVNLPQNGGLMQRTLDVLDSFCIDAQVSQYGKGGDPQPVLGC
jgi:hypothetical protein